MGLWPGRLYLMSLWNSSQGHGFTNCSQVSKRNNNNNKFPCKPEMCGYCGYT